MHLKFCFLLLFKAPVYWLERVYLDMTNIVIKKIMLHMHLKFIQSL